MPDLPATPMRLQPVPSAAATARRRVAEACQGRMSAEATETARLLVSELVTNCLLHAHSAITLSIDCSEDTLEVEVGDDGDELPIVKQPTEDSHHGRGMWLVDALAADWGITARPAGGKIVWFRLP
jgi:anti-sigma regulatory factor (Ser/Thr protein kinase)